VPAGKEEGEEGSRAPERPSHYHVQRRVQRPRTAPTPWTDADTSTGTSRLQRASAVGLVGRIRRTSPDGAVEGGENGRYARRGWHRRRRVASVLSVTRAWVLYHVLYHFGSANEHFSRFITVYQNRVNRA